MVHTTASCPWGFPTTKASTFSAATQHIWQPPHAARWQRAHVAFQRAADESLRCFRDKTALCHAPRSRASGRLGRQTRQQRKELATQNFHNPPDVVEHPAQCSAELGGSHVLCKGLAQGASAWQRKRSCWPLKLLDSSAKDEQHGNEGKCACS